MLRAACVVLGLVLSAAAAQPSSPVPGPQALNAFIPVGVIYRPPADDRARRRDFEEMQRLRFTVVRITEPPAPRLAHIDRLLASAPYPDVDAFPNDTPAVIPARLDADAVTRRAWSALGRGTRVILFDDWAALVKNADALAAAAAFAEAVTRNATLYAALEPRVPRPDAPPIRVRGGGQAIEVHVLQSAAALVIVAVNTGRAPHRATLTFPLDIPEAIWQNMATGATVHFVTGPDGPAYTRTFAPQEVLVLMINTRLR